MNTTAKTKVIKKKEDTAFGRLLADQGFLNIPKAGDVVHGTILFVSKNLVRIDLPSYRTGVVRGTELTDASGEARGLKIGDEVEATVIDLENENGEVELSFKYAGERRAWEKAAELMRQGTVIPAKIVEANKGGLTMKIANVIGFIPVSQLSPENYPRVSGGDKQKIFEKLRSFVGKTLNVKVIDVNEAAQKLIVSEKAVWEDAQRSIISNYKVGDTIEGEVTALTDFGVFVKFGDSAHGAASGESSAESAPLEGLVHISEIAWQRIDHPKDVLAMGDKVRAQIIGLEGSKIFLSIKNLIDDPWKRVHERYQVGALVKGKILKANPFGFFVELDPEIHGLAHISELADKPVRDLDEIAKIGDTIEWRIVSIEPDQHRLGLSLKTMKEESN